MSWPMSGLSTIMNTDESLPVMRYPETLGSGVTYADGKTVVVPTTLVVYQVICNVQPLTGNDLLQLPEGQRYNDQFWLWTNQNQMAVEVGDLISRTSKTYECQSAQAWGSYTRARCVSIDTQTLPNAENDGTSDGSELTR